MTIHPFEEEIENDEEGNLRNKIESSSHEEEKIYSQSAGIAYGIFFGILLWWIPIAGPSIAGYLSGRKSGKPSAALISSLVSSAVIMFLALLFAPWTSGPLAAAGAYFSTGVLHLSSSGFIVNGFLGGVYSSYAFVKSFALILPGSLVLLNVFSLVGGAQSELKVSEKAMSVIYAKRRMNNNFRRVPRVRLERKPIKEFNDARVVEEDEEETSKGWTYL